MGIPAVSENPAPARLSDRLSNSLILSYAALALYGAVVMSAIWHHEPWADEAHAWLLARDSNLVGLWTRLLHYEGTPGLWHTLLWALIRLGIPYRGEDVTAGLLGLAAAWMVVRRSPFPLVIRLLLPFTYFLCYQYVVVARSYSLLPILLFGAALLYHKAEQKLPLFTLVLCLLAAVSAHGFLLSVSIWAASMFRFIQPRKQLDPSVQRMLVLTCMIYALVLMLVAYSSWPAKDVAFPAHATLDPVKIMHFAGMLLAEGFTGSLVLTLVVIGLSIPFLYAGKGLLPLVLSLLALAGFGGVVYSQVWHSGTLFLAWLTAMWISAATTRLPRTAIAAFAIVIVIQCFWTARTVSYDWQQPYSGSKEAALYLKRAGIAQHSIYAIGYSCSAIQPYFPRGVFTNFPAGQAYWDWSTRNRTDEPGALFSSKAPEYVIVGYKAASDMDWLAGYLQRSGYQQIKHFSGHLFWQTYEFEAEDFDLYQQKARRLIPTASYLRMGDAEASKQLLSGFYNLEQNAWRWSARTFTVLLKPPAGASVSGARLEVHLYLAQDQIDKLGAMTLTADVNGYRVPPQTFSSAGTHVYERDIPASVLTANSVLAGFAFDKALPPLSADGRELGAVISELGLKARP